MKPVARILSAALILATAFAGLPTTSVRAELLGPMVCCVEVSPDLITIDDLVTVTARVASGDYVGSPIPEYAEFSVDDSPWMEFLPNDGVWDAFVEDVTIQWLPVHLGETILCIQAYAGGWWSDPTCTAFNVYPPQDTTAPTTTAVATSPASPFAGDLVTVTATVTDTGSVISGVASAEFNVDGGAFTAMAASDGAFDDVSEGVTGSFTAGTSGLTNVCVRGTDAWGNVGDAACIDVTVQPGYAFGGFLSPVDLTGTKAKAGKGFVLRFQLTMAADGSPVSDPGAIAAVRSYGVDCTTLSGDASSAVAEGGGGPNYLGNGIWRFNWQVPGSYAGTCRMVFVSFSDGSASPTALFKFK